MGVTFRVENEAAFLRAVKIAPKAVASEIRKQFRATAKRIVKQERLGVLFGRPGIHLPAKDIVIGARGKNKGKARIRKGRATDARRLQEAHIKALVNRSGSPVLYAYGSKFLGYHHVRILRLFEAIFGRVARASLPGLLKEITRIAQLTMDGELSKSGFKHRGQR